MSAISYTRVSTYLSCPMKYKLKYIDRIDPGRTSLNRLWGSAWHKGIERFHTDETPHADGLLGLVAFELAERMKPYGLDAYVNTMLGLLPDFNSMVDSIDSKSPHSTKKYKEWMAENKVAELRAAAREQAATHPELSYPEEDLWKRLTLHRWMLPRYLAFDATHPLVRFADGAPAIEVDLTLDSGLGPIRLIIDQLRDINVDTPYPVHGVAPIDLKSWVSDPKPNFTADDYQLLHYQLGLTLCPDLPDPEGAGHYSLRTGTLNTQPKLPPTLVADWAACFQAMQTATVFPRQRSERTCSQCDFYAEHCATAPLPEGAAPDA